MRVARTTSSCSSRESRRSLDDQPSFVDDIQHHGLLTRTVADLVASLPAVCGPSFLDPTTSIPDLQPLEPGAGVAGLRIAVSDDIGFFEVQPEVRARLAEVATALEKAGAIVSRPRLDWSRAIADGWVRHCHVYLAAFFGDAIDSIGPLADPRLAAVIAKGRMHDAVSIRQLNLVRKQQWDALSELFRDHDVLLSPTDPPRRQRRRGRRALSRADAR